jgi:integrase
MAVIEKRGDKWRVLIRRKGHKAISKTFKLKVFADRYARDTESAIEARTIGADDPKLSDVLDSYTRLKTLCHFSHLKHADRTKRLFGHLKASDLNGTRLLEIIEKHGLGPASADKHLGILQAALRTHEGLTGALLGLARFSTGKKALRKAGVAKAARRRTRRLTDTEIAAVKAAVRYQLPFDKLIDLSVLTCLRLGELLRIRWADLDHERKMIFVRDRKHPTEKIGNDSWVPLLNGAYELVMSLPQRKERIVPYHPKSIQNLWMAATKKAGAVDANWHDLRHEGISRLFERGYGVAEVALVSGHRDWKALRIYVQLKPEMLHGGPRGLDR